MANPSLQIGNSNWAIKEDNLLGYSTAGTRFVPQPITMTRASAGTRVNSSGLVETVELLGSELVTNGDFESGTSGWSAYYSGTLNNTGNALNVVDAGAGGSRASTSITTVIGKTYKFVSDVLQVQSTNTVIAVSNAVNLDGAFINSTITTPTNGVTVYFTATATTTFIGFKRSGGGVGITNIYDNVSVKESTKNNLARVDYDGTASSLLAEPQRINLITYSEDFSQWSTNATVTLNAAISPDGTQNASLFSHSGGSFPQVALTGITFVSGADYSPSLYVKSDGTEQVQHSLLINNVVVNFTPTDEWVRISDLIVSPDTSGSFVIAQNSGSSVAASFYIWGAQLEEGSYATSYIPTDGSTVTRVQDQYSKTGISNLINSEEGVLFLEMAALADDGTDRKFSISDGTSSNFISIIYRPTSNQVRGAIVTGGVNQVLLSFVVTDATAFNKIAFKWKAGDFALWIGGVEVVTSSSGSIPTGLNKISNDNGGGSFYMYSKVKQLQVFKTALTDSELATLTT